MELLLSILLFALVATITPGPNNIMIMTSGLNYGITRTLPHFFGICLGFPTMVIAVGLGLGSLFQSFPVLHSIIRILGISYLLYLAWKIATTKVSPAMVSSTPQNQGAADESSDSLSKPLSFVQAALFQWVNPKAWVMVVSSLAAFTSVGSELFTQALLIALSFFLVSFPCVGTWLLGGAFLRRLFKRPGQLQVFNVTMAILLALSILPMLSTDQFF